MLAGMAALSVAACSAPRNADVVVVGAGAAGIGAALRLAELGLTCVVLEAAGRIGGRAYTDTATFGVPFDIGCAWIHAADRNPFFRYAKDYHYRLRPHDLDLTRLYYGPHLQGAAELGQEHGAEETIHERVTELASHEDVATSEAVPRWTKPFDAAATYMGPMDMGVDLNDLATVDYNDSADLNPNYLVYEGFGTLVKKVGAAVPVRLRTPVRTIRHGQGRSVRVETHAGTIEAKAVIVTVSTGVLAAGAIRFDPALPEWKEAAIGEVPMGLLAKIPLLIRGDRFGIAPFQNILVETPGLQDIYFLSWPFDTNLMVGFVGGLFGWQLSAAGEDAAIDFAKERLGQAFGSGAPKKVVRGLFTNWAGNPLTRGAYAAALPGHSVAREPLGLPLSGRVFFAGEALAGPLIQTCGGAFLSGRETAQYAADTLAGRKTKAMLWQKTP